MIVLMIRRPPEAKLTDTRLPYTPLFRSDGTSQSGTVCASTGAAPTAAKAIRPVMVENLVICTLFEKVRTLRISGYARWSSAIRHGSHLMEADSPRPLNPG